MQAGNASLCLNANLRMALIPLMFQRSFVVVQCLYNNAHATCQMTGADTQNSRKNCVLRTAWETALANLSFQDTSIQEGTSTDSSQKTLQGWPRTATVCVAQGQLVLFLPNVQTKIKREGSSLRNELPSKPHPNTNSIWVLSQPGVCLYTQVLPADLISEYIMHDFETNLLL